jgi:outer membrane protein TolC
MPLKVALAVEDLNPTIDFASQATPRLTLTQELPVSGRLEAQGRAAQAFADREDASRDQTVRDKLLAFDREVFQYRLDRQILENLDAEIWWIDQLNRAVKIQYATGKVSYSVLLSLQIRSADLEATRLARRLDLQTSLLDLQELAGLDDPNFQVTTPSLDVPVGGWPVLSVASLVQGARANSPQRQALVRDREAAAAGADLERAKAYPDLGLMAGAAWQGMTGKLLFSVGVDWGLPLGSGEAVGARIEAADLQVTSQDQAVTALDQALKKRIQRLVATRQANLDQLTLLDDRALRAGQDNIAHMLAEYQVQASDLQAVVDAVVTTFELKNRAAELVAGVGAIDQELKALSGSENLTARTVP